MLFRIACFLTGDNPNLVERYDVTSRKKICLQALNLLIPTSIWFFSGLGCAYVILGKPLWLSLAVGCLMATFIFVIDRTIISLPSSWKVNLMRVGIGTMMALLGATIVDLLIFDDEIKNEIAMTTSQQADSIATIKTQLTRQEIDQQEQKTEELFSLWSDKEQKYELEVTGKLSGRRGVDTIARSIKAQASELEARYSTERARLDSLKATLSNQLDTEKSLFTAGHSQNGILNRIKALHAILKRDDTLVAAYLLLTGICLFLELSVVLFKMLMPQSPYDDNNDKYQGLIRKRLSTL